MDLDYQQKIEEITQWIQRTVKEAGFENVIVAVSGGIDSAVSLALCVRALGKDHVYAVRLPYGKMSTQATEDAKLVTTSLGLAKDHVLQKDIYKVVNKIYGVIPDLDHELQPFDKLREEIASSSSTTGNDRLVQIRKGNIMARVRMIFLYDLSKEKNVLVVGTENKSEYYLGYFTRFGDEASDIEPLRSLYKTQVREMAKALGLPEQIITKVPTAGLWEGQTDEKEFGFSYAEADQVLYHYFDERLPKEALVNLGLQEDVIEKVLQRVEANNFKHHLPIILED